MSYRYFEHEADIGIQSWGNTLEKAFSQGAQGMLDLISRGRKKKMRKISIKIKEKELLMLWIAFLNKVLGEMDIKKIIARTCKVKKITRKGNQIELTGEIGYVQQKPDDKLKREVKAATYCKANVEKQNKGWMVQCVLDL